MTVRERRPFLWITDPWDTLDHPNDTTLRLAQESLRLGFRSAWCDVRSIRFESGKVRLDARELLRIPSGASARKITRGDSKTHSPQEFRQLHYRTDPPVDLAYLQPLQILSLGCGPLSAIINPPSTLLMDNEKLSGAFLGKSGRNLMPPSVASALWEPLESFGKKEGRTVLKPLHLAQSKGVELLDWTTASGQRAARRTLQAVTEGFTRPILLQRFLPGIAEGEQRLWFVDGKLLAYARKLPQKNDFRVNIDGGSRIVPTTLSRREKAVAAEIGRHLKTREIRLAAVDLIEGWITDFNFTSPGLITGMEKALGINLARPIIEALA